MAFDQGSKIPFPFLPTLTLMCAILLSVSLFGAAGYSKFRLDQSQNVLAAPDSAFSPDEEIYEKSIIALGYSGFIGSAQNFMNTRDRAALGDMRMNYKTASQTIKRLSKKATAPVRRDVTAILSLFASIISKAETSDALSDGVTGADLLRASSALSILDSRMRTALAAGRLHANNNVQQWSMLLMVVAWMSALFLAGGAVIAYIIYRSRLNAPLESLAQSVDNMVNDDMTQSIWGIERRDSVGHLARSLDNARLYFAEIPDLSLKSSEGTIRLKFEAKQRSAFETMMTNMNEAFEQAQHSSKNFNMMLETQGDTLGALTTSLSSTLSSVQEKGALQESSVSDLTDTLSGSVSSLTEVLSDTVTTLSCAQEKSIKELDQLAPAMKDRIQNMAEITQLAGGQVTQSLESLIRAEKVMRNNTTQSQEVTKQLAHATNQMGERMFASVNLMQTSSKSLNEATSDMRDRFSAAINTLSSGETNLQQIIMRAEDRLNNTIGAEEKMAGLTAKTEESASKMERAVDNICERHEGLSEQVVTATHRMDSIVASFDSAQRAMSDATQQVRRDGTQIGGLLTDLRTNNEQLLSTIHSNSQSSHNSVQSLAEKSHALMQRLEVQIGQHAQATEAHIDELGGYSQSMVQHANNTTSSLGQTIASLHAEQEKLSTARGRFVDTITDIGTRFEQQATNTFGKTERFAADSFSKMSDIADQVEGVMKRLSMLGQLTGTLGTVAGQLGQLVPALSQMQADGTIVEGPMPTVDMEETKGLIVAQTEEMITELQGQWHTAVVQIEAMHDQLAQMMVQQKDQLETRLVVMDKKISSKSAKGGIVEAEENRQAEIVNQLIGAVSDINKHVIEIDGAIEDAGLKKDVG